MALYISMKIRGLGVLVIINRFVILSFIEKKIWLDFNMYWWTKNWLSCDVFNVGRATQWAFADSRLGVNPKADPETIGLSILTLKQVAKGEAITFLRCPDQRYYWQGTWRALHPRRILHAPGFCVKNWLSNFLWKNQSESKMTENETIEIELTTKPK